MSHRSRDDKKLNRLRHALRQTPDTSLDLVQWLKDRRYAQTTGEALRALLDGRVKADGSVVGRLSVANEEGEEQHKEIIRYIPASYRDRLEYV